MDDAGAARRAFSIGRLFWFFLRIGCTAFGGFMSLISIIQIELTEKRRVMEQKDMLNGIALASILPGPVAVNVTAYAGFRLYGVAGAAAAMLAVILPSFVLMIVAAELYLRWGELPVIRAVFNGIIPAIVAVILQAGWNIGRKTVTGVKPFAVALLAALAIILFKGFYVTLAVIFIAGALGPLLFRDAAGAADDAAATSAVPFALQWLFAFLLAVLLLLFLLPAPDFIRAAPVAHLFTTFSGMSLTLFGGGYVFIPMIQKIVVESYHWITADEFNAAIAMGQITPGPILISATFIGYKVAGIAGAVIATLGIFLPPAMLLVLAAHWLGHLRKSALLQRVLHGIRIAVCGMIFAAAVLIAGTAGSDWGVLVIFVLALAALMFYKVTPVLVIPAAGALGLALHAAGV
ncbi:MAG: chromate efflux transporter [Gammaproteobacteria bacterium]|nr:chromate efflux transporter [Gammaproteobacteria bacterium]